MTNHTQIDNTTTTMIITREESCAICMEAMSSSSRDDNMLKLLPCKHQFHFNCIIPCLFKHNNCPTCGFNLPEHAPFKYLLRKFPSVLNSQNKDWRSQTLGLIVAMLTYLNLHPTASIILIAHPIVNTPWKQLCKFISQEFYKKSEAEAQLRFKPIWNTHSVQDSSCPFCNCKFGEQTNMESVFKHLYAVLTISPKYETLVQHVFMLFMCILYLIRNYPESPRTHLKPVLEAVIDGLNGLLVLISDPDNKNTLRIY